MIFFFSATGNCKYVADRVAAATGQTCVSIAACVQAQQFTFSPAGEESVGIVSPVYFWGLPTIVNEFLERLRLDRPAYLWFAATFGTTTGQAGRFAAEHLEKRGLTLDACFSVRMPDSWTPIFDLSDKDKVERTLLAAEPQIDALIRRILRRDRGDFMRRPALLPPLRAGAPHGALCGDRRLRRLRPVREELPRLCHRAAGGQARLDQKAVRHVPFLSAPLPEVRHTVRRQDRKARAVCPSAI